MSSKGNVKIIQYGNPALEKVSDVVKDIASPEIKSLIEDMFSALKKRGDTAAGLSAVQIGVLKRVTICRRLDIEDRKNRTSEKPVWEIMINPEYISKSKATTTEWEGCLSINNGDLFGRVTRPAEVEVKFFNEKGEEKKIKASGYFAHVVQHELDHLDGVLFLKYIEDPEELHTAEELRGE